MSRGVNDYDAARIQGRNVSNANSYSIVSPGLVTDGLILHLDAGNFNSYPISGTTWYNLSDIRNSGTIGNFTYVRDGGGSLDMNASAGSNITFGDPYFCDFSAQDFSFNIFLYITSTTTSTGGQGPVLLFKGGFQIRGYYAQVSQASPAAVTFFTNQSGAVQTSLSTASITIGAWNNICFTRSGSSVRIYINGIDATSTAGTHSNPSGSSDTLIINSYGAQIYGNVTYAIFSAYNRTLTPTEVEQNFNATRARFGV
jgi:hypothetical protein